MTKVNRTGKDGIKQLSGQDLARGLPVMQSEARLGAERNLPAQPSSASVGLLVTQWSRAHVGLLPPEMM